MADLLEPQTTLPLVPDYAGETLAVDENTGNLCSGTFELTVNWGDDSDSDIITARIIDLEGVCGGTRDWFRHNSRDVGTIFLPEIDIDGDATSDPGVFSAADATAQAFDLATGPPVLKREPSAEPQQSAESSSGTATRKALSGCSEHGRSPDRVPTPVWTSRDCSEPT